MTPKNPWSDHGEDPGQSFYFREPLFLDHKGWPMVADQLILQTVFLGVLAAVIVKHPLVAAQETS